jgi:hypothetical protein
MANIQKHLLIIVLTPILMIFSLIPKPKGIRLEKAQARNQVPQSACRLWTIRWKDWVSRPKGHIYDDGYNHVRLTPLNVPN